MHPLLPLVFMTVAQGQVQAQPSTANMPKAFEVASIKPNAANDNRIMLRMAPGGSFVATGVTLQLLIGQAFDMRNHQIIGGPGWISSERYDINAKGPEGMPDRVPPEMLRPMLRSLVEDRFQLKSHTEEREMPVYVLTQAKGGHKLTVAEQAGGPGGNRRMQMGRGLLDAKGAPIALLIQQLSQQLGRTIIDKTGLDGVYDYKLEWTPDPGMGGGGGHGAPPPSGDSIAASDSSGPTIFTALQEKLGLKLDTQKGPVPVLIIDSVAKPTEN